MDIKVTQIKTTKQNKQYIKLLKMDELMKIISIGKYCTEISRLNDFMYYAESTSPFKGLHRLPAVLGRDEKAAPVLEHVPQRFRDLPDPGPAERVVHQRR